MKNPFPGLRPFNDNKDDTEVFFGRDGQVDELLARLHRQRFVAVVGESGCGKSSLVRAGLLPALRGGFLAGAGSRWRIGVMRPGSSPIASLAQALDLPQDMLEGGSLGLVKAVQGAQLSADENVLLVVDQFEELFRFRHSGSLAHASDAAAAFVKLILAAAQHRDVPVYILITMRSDFIGECARFRDLPETLNDGLYLVPRLTRDQLREVIEGPVHMRDAQIEPRLVNQVLNDLGDDPDQLPLLQVALLCTWNHWEARMRPDQPIALEDYAAVGGLSDALSQQGDRILGDLPEHARALTSRIFKALTDNEIRRPLFFATLVPIVGASEQQVRDLIDVWRAPGVSFLMPPPDKPIQADTVIDLSHEALMRAWGTLRRWVAEEAEAGKLYRRLLEDAQMYDRGRGMLLSDPTLRFAEEWRDKEHPTEAWAARYGGSLASVLALIQRSRKAADFELGSAGRQQRRTLMIAVVMTVIALFALGGLGYAALEAHRANAAEATAEGSKNSAQAALQNLQVATRRLQIAYQKLRVEKIIADKKTKQAEVARRNEQRMAWQATQTSHEHAAEAGSALLARVDESLYSARFSDYRLLGLVGVNSYVLHPSVEAREQLLEAAYTPGALARVALPPWNLGAITSHGMLIPVLAGQEQTSYAAPVSGSLLIVDASTLSLITRRTHVTGTLMCGFDADSRFALASAERIDLYDAGGFGIPRVVSYNSGPVQALACSPVSETAYFVDSAGTLRAANLERGTSAKVGKVQGTANGLIVSPHGKYAAVSTSSGEVTVFDLRGKSRAFARRLLSDERHDCLMGGCSGALTFNADDTLLAWYDRSFVHTRRLSTGEETSRACAATICDHPTLAFYQPGLALPAVIAERIVTCCNDKHIYSQIYDNGAGAAAHHALFDPELQLYVTPYNPDKVKEPNPLHGGLAEGALVREDAPLIGRFPSSNLIGSYAVRANQILLAADHGYLAFDLDHLRETFGPSSVVSHLVSHSVKLRDSGDGVHGISYNYDTGEVRVLDFRSAIPSVVRRFFAARVARKNGKYLDVERIAYDPGAEVVTLASRVSIDRYTASGRHLSSLSVAALMKKGDILEYSSEMLSSRGKYIGVRGRGAAALFNAQGALLGTFSSIDAISADERYLFVFGNAQGTTTESIIEMPKLDSVGITAIPGSAENMALSPDGSTIAYDDLRDDSNEVRLYDVRSRTSYRNGLPKPPSLGFYQDAYENELPMYRDIAFSHDGRYLLVVYDDEDGQSWIAVYSVDPKVWVRTACLEAGRPLSVAELHVVAGNSAPFVNGCAAFESEMYRW